MFQETPTQLTTITRDDVKLILYYLSRPQAFSDSVIEAPALVARLKQKVFGEASHVMKALDR